MLYISNLYIDLPPFSFPSSALHILVPFLFPSGSTTLMSHMCMCVHVCVPVCAYAHIHMWSGFQLRKKSLAYFLWILLFGVFHLFAFFQENGCNWWSFLWILRWWLQRCWLQAMNQYQVTESEKTALQWGSWQAVLTCGPSAPGIPGGPTSPFFPWGQKRSQS